MNKLSMIEMVKLCPGMEDMTASHQEIGNLAPDSSTEG